MIIATEKTEIDIGGGGGGQAVGPSGDGASRVARMAERPRGLEGLNNCGGSRVSSSMGVREWKMVQT